MIEPEKRRPRKWAAEEPTQEAVEEVAEESRATEPEVVDEGDFSCKS
jgi:hypothetical protein